MKKVLLIYAVLIAGIIAWYYGVGKVRRITEDRREKALEVGKHSVEFNRAMNEIMSNYYAMTADFVKEDTVSINKSAEKVRNSLNTVKIDELKSDSSIFETAATILDDTRTEIAGMLVDPSLQAKRESLNLFSNELFTFLLTIHFDTSKLYWQECSSAFGDDTPGNWISSAEKSENPYGKKDCATVKKVIDFTPPDSSATVH